MHIFIDVLVQRGNSCDKEAIINDIAEVIAWVFVE